jgi:pSer/pThr/pTyr-binding forkhead associated (FHA) protein
MASSKTDAGKGQAPLGVLVLARPGKPVQRFHLTKPAISVGRSEGVTLRIPAPEVSRKHCLLSFKNGFWHVQDQGSSNGTFVNGTRVSGLTQINPGSKLRIGKVEFVLQYTLQADAARRLRQGQLLEALAVPEEEPDEVELVDLEDLPDAPDEGQFLPAIPVDAEMELELELDEEVPPIPARPPTAVTLRDEPLIALLPEEDDFPPVPVVPEGRGSRMPPPVPEAHHLDQPPLADLRDLLSQLAEPAPEAPKNKSPRPKGKG